MNCFIIIQRMKALSRFFYLYVSNFDKKVLFVISIREQYLLLNGKKIKISRNLHKINNKVKFNYLKLLFSYVKFEVNSFYKLN